MTSKMTVEREPALAAVKKLIGLVPRDVGKVPVLRNVVMKGTPHGHAMAVCGDAYAAVPIKAGGSRDPILFPCVKLAEILGELTDETVEIEAKDNGQLRVASDHAEFICESYGDIDKFNAYLPPLIERLADIERDHAVEVNAELFSTAAERVVYAAPADGSRGILLEVEDGKFRLAATDGRRLAIATGQTLGGGLRTSRPVLLTPGFVTAIKRAMIADGTATLAVHEGHVAAWCGDNIVCGPESATRFPEIWRKVIPVDAASIVSPAELLSKAIKQAMAISDGESTERVLLQIANGSACFRAGQDSRARVALRATVPAKLTIEVLLQPKQMLQALSHVAAGEEVDVLCTSVATRLRCCGGDFVYVSANLQEQKD